MPGNGAATHGRPLCRCHGEPADNAGNGKWSCAVKRRARQLARYHANPAAANYARERHRLRSAIRRKRQQVKELEERLAEEIARGDGEGEDR